MTSLTPKKLKEYLRDYDYEISTQQANDILVLLDDWYGVFTSVDIQEAANYILTN